MARAGGDDVLGTGTVGTGCILELSARHSPEQFPYLRAGDEVGLRIDRLGELRAPVLPSQRGAWPGLRAVAPVG